MIARNLSTWTPPEGMARSLQSAGVDFDLVYGWDYATSVLDHIKTNNRQGLAEVYKLALADPSACGIIRAKRPDVEVFVYDGAQHGFGCDERASYDKASADLAKQRSLAFFAKHLVK